MELRMKVMLTCVCLLCDVTRYVIASPEITIASQIPVFARHAGFILGRGTRSARVLLEVYLDLQCPDSADAWPIIQKVSRHYDPQDVSVVLHQMPLPYHMNAFTITCGYHLVQDKAPHRLHSYVDMSFKHLDELGETTNPEWGMDYLISNLSVLQEPHTEITAADFTAAIKDYDDIARAEWKLGAARGVAGAPWFFVNGVAVKGVEHVPDYKAWLKVLDQLVQLSDDEHARHGVNLFDLYPPVTKETRSVAKETSQVNDAASVARQSRSSSKKCRTHKTWKKYLQHLLKKGYYLVKYKK